MNWKANEAMSMHMKKIPYLGMILVAFGSTLLSSKAEAGSDDPGGNAAQCTALASVDFTQIQDAPTQLLAAKPVTDRSDGIAYCRVRGYVAPQVGFEVRLPLANWNHKLLVQGHGGWGGTLWGAFCDSYVARGYACAISDTGHKSTIWDALWARNNLQAQVDFAFRAYHVTTLAAKAITEKYYAKGPERSYFVGCSGGGDEAMAEAEVFPKDFDGIVAEEPDLDAEGYALRAAWGSRNFLDENGKPVLSSQDLDLLHRAALADCQDDGLKDGIIGNPMACRFDPARLLCKSRKTPECLTRAQLDAVKRIYAGPTTSAGEPITWGTLPGSELSWSFNFDNPHWQQFAVQQALGYTLYGAEPPVNSLDFDREYQRVGLGDLLRMPYANPDLRRFKAAGGKLIGIQGGNDHVLTARDFIDYYETAQRTMGGRAATQEFFRLFLVPGLNHCGGGNGTIEFDRLGALEAWVEQGKAPDVIIGARVSDSYIASAKLPTVTVDISSDEDVQVPANLNLDARRGLVDRFLKFPLDPSIPVTLTRPFYPYPLYPKYKGRGDPHNAANFVPVSP